MKFAILLVAAAFVVATASIPLRKKEIIDPIPCPKLEYSHGMLVIGWECLDPEGWSLLKNMEMKEQQLEEASQLPEVTDKGILNKILDTVKYFFK